MVIYGVTVTPQEPLPPVPPPTAAELLHYLEPHCWAVLTEDANEVLRELWQREPHLLRRKVTKLDGEMWSVWPSNDPDAR